MLTITTPASNLLLLTAEQLRVAAGLPDDDTSQDDDLEETGLRVASDIATACKVAVGASKPPTLLQETLTERLRDVCRDVIILSRRHDVEITSVVADGTTLSASDYEVEPESGLLYRLSGESRVGWYATLVTIVYKAGFVDVPSDLAGAASDLMRLRLSEGDRDPLVKGETIEIPDVETRRTDYWVGGMPGSGSDGPVPATILGKLSRYMNYTAG